MKFPFIGKFKLMACVSACILILGILAGIIFGVNIGSFALSTEAILNALLSLVVAGILALIYVWIRLDVYAGVVAFLIMLHDVAVMAALTSICRAPIGKAFLAAAMAVALYSIYNTSVVFSHIGENCKHVPHVEKRREELVNKSIQDLALRSILLFLAAFLIVLGAYALGGIGLSGFALPMMAGLLAGLYSSVYLAGSLWVKWHASHQVKGQEAKKSK